MGPAPPSSQSRSCFAMGSVVLTSPGHTVALEPKDKGLMGTLLRYPYEARDPQKYFDDNQDVKVTKDMLDFARHIVNEKAGRFEPAKIEDRYETSLAELRNQKRAGKPSVAKARPSGENVVDLGTPCARASDNDIAAVQFN